MPIAREKLIDMYANLAMAHFAVASQATAYSRSHYAIRSRFRSKLRSGEWRFSSLADDERLKMTYPQACCYCGSIRRLSLDHLIPTFRGGDDSGDNLVWACRSCNSAKGARDLLEWYGHRSEFPPLLLLRRYLKLAFRSLEARGLLDLPPDQSEPSPFALHALPDRFPPPTELRLWIFPPEAATQESGTSQPGPWTIGDILLFGNLASL